MLTEKYDDVSNRVEAFINFLVVSPTKIDAIELKRSLRDVRNVTVSVFL